nr:immunoglobulin light chain junction region [Macaca mulatta]MOW08872.1 immunoglobulin light chain junction region [Macaca mulatta]MOW08913.1 immunoglobulin light chain junction region [Macaca mulatta]MOW08998.1 immunoglobulin light chain junction region [Macaca mulatta]MOW09600.1 immunoglobulin light chain junction region [Macaca mulatta]
CQQHHSYPWTF